MESLTQFSELTKIYSRCADFLFVYVQEAHPQGGWELNDNVSVNEHANMKERIQATDFLHSLNCHIIVDNMENSTSRLYGAFPARLVIIEEKLITYQGGMAPFDYHLHEVQDYLRRKFGAADSNV